MTDALLTQPDQKEALSRAYVQAVAARAGYTTAQPEVDRDSVDLTISAGGEMRPGIDLQLKATTRLNVMDGLFSFELSIKNYDHLWAPTQTPRLLVVLDMPSEEELWMTCSSEELVLRRSVYWASLRGRVETDNTTSVTIQIAQSNRFDVAELITLMDASRRGVIE